MLTQICFIKSPGHSLKFAGLLMALLFIMGCESLISDISRLIKEGSAPQEKNNIKPENEESSITLAANIYLSKPGNLDIKNNCEQLWANFKNNPDPRSLIGLAATIKMEYSHAPCRKYLESKIGQRIDNYFFTKEKNLPVESAKTRIRFKFLFLLLLAHNPETARMDNLRHLLKSNPELIKGKFFDNATPHQNVILQSLFCSAIGKTLVKNSAKAAAFKNPATYIGRCFEKESKRAFLLARKTGTPARKKKD